MKLKYAENTNYTIKTALKSEIKKKLSSLKIYYQVSEKKGVLKMLKRDTI